MKAHTFIFFIFFPFPLYLFISFILYTTIKLWSSPTSHIPFLSLNIENTDIAKNISIIWDCDPRCNLIYKKSNETLIKTISHQENYNNPYTFILDNLSPNSQYFYDLDCNFEAKHSKFKNGNINQEFNYNFRTFGEQRNKRIILISDTQVNPTGISHMPIVMKSISHMVNENSVIIIAGDITHIHDSQKLWNNFVEKSAQYLQNKGIFTVPGNHDCLNISSNSCLYSKYLVPANSHDVFKGYGHYLEYGKNIIIIGYTDYEEIHEKYWKNQIDWISKTLEKFKSKPIKILVGHRPFLFKEKIENREGPYLQLLSLFDKYNVSLIINGHQHAYRRFHIKSEVSGRTMINLIVGGGGGTLESALYTGSVKNGNFTAKLKAQNLAPSFSFLDIENDESVSIRTYSVAKIMLDLINFDIDSNGNVKFTDSYDSENDSEIVTISPHTILSAIAYLNIAIIILYSLFTIFLGAKKKGVFHLLREFILRNSEELSPTNEFKEKLLLHQTDFIQKIRRKPVYCFLIPRVILSPISSVLVICFAFSANSAISVYIKGAYNYTNNMQYLSTFIMCLFSSAYLWICLNYIETNYFRLLINIGELLIFFLFPNHYNETFEMFENDLSTIFIFGLVTILGIFMEIVLAGGTLELAILMNKIKLIELWINLFCPVKKMLQNFEKWVSSPIFCIFSMILILELSCCWAGLSISGAVNLLSSNF